MMDYIDWRGDLTFDESPFNDVDNLIFAELAYLNMADIVSEELTFTVTIKELCEQYKAHGYDQSYLVNVPLPMLEKAASCARYRHVRVGGYIDRVAQDEQIQFACASFLPGDGTLCIAFRGTDNSIVGWREDFNISYLSQTPGQAEAAAYVNRVAAETDYPLRIVGHSKGGNFAVYAAAFCEKTVKQKRILRVYSDDGPGFNHGVVNSEEYLSVLDKVIKIIPESSLVGILLSGKEKVKVVKSSAKGMLQHDPYTWCVMGTDFELADKRSQSSIFMDETLTKWMDTLDDQEKKSVVSAIFDSLDASGASTITEMNANGWVSYNAIAKAAKQLNAATYSEVLESLKKLAVAGGEVLWNEARKSFEAFGQNMQNLRSNKDET